MKSRTRIHENKIETIVKTSKNITIFKQRKLMQLKQYQGIL